MTGLVDGTWLLIGHMGAWWHWVATGPVIDGGCRVFSLFFLWWWLTTSRAVDGDWTVHTEGGRLMVCYLAGAARC